MARVRPVQVCLICPRAVVDGRPESHGYCRYHGLMRLADERLATQEEVSRLGFFGRILAKLPNDRVVRSYLFGFEENPARLP